MMRAIAIDRFGGPEVLQVRTMPTPEPGPRDVLIRVQTAGVGEWDPFAVRRGMEDGHTVEVRLRYRVV